MMIKRLFFTCALLVSFYAKATFTLNGAGTEITQTGIDTDLSGLAIITGVTTFSLGTGSDGRTIYFIGDRKLIIEGTLSINPELEAVYAGENSPRSVFEIVGTLNINGEIIENGVARYSERLFMWSPYQNGNCCNQLGLRVRNGGTLNWIGGTMRIGSALSFDAGSNITTTGARLIQDKNNDNQLRQSTTNWVCNSFSFSGNDITFIAIPNSLNNYEPLGARGALSFSTSTPNVDFPINNYSSNGSSDSDIRLWQGSRPILTNSKTGSDLKVAPHISGNANSYGVAIIKQELQVNVIDGENNNVENAVIYTRDTNNGNREIYNREGHTVDATNDLTYTQVTSASGSTPVFDITTAYNIANNGNGDPVNTGNYAWDYRGNSNDASDIFTFNVYSYLHGYDSFEGILKGTEVLQLNTTIFNDPFISETNQATVSAYTGIAIDHNAQSITISEDHTLCELYDFVKFNKLSNVELPTISTLATTPQNTNLNIADYQLVITGSAVLSPCDKFVRISSNVTSSLNDPNVNLQISLTDASNTYRLIQVNNIVNGDILIIDENTSTTLFQDTNVTGTVNLVTTSNSNNVSILVSREAFSNWSVDVDLSTADSFTFTVSQSALTNSSAFALKSLQEDIIYLMIKTLQKNQAIQSELNDATVPTINLNTITQPSASEATKEKQEEMINLLRIILSKTQAIRTGLND